jgi:hypothetical protein
VFGEFGDAALAGWAMHRTEAFDDLALLAVGSAVLEVGFLVEELSGLFTDVGVPEVTPTPNRHTRKQHHTRHIRPQNERILTELVHGIRRLILREIVIIECPEYHQRQEHPSQKRPETIGQAIPRGKRHKAHKDVLADGQVDFVQERKVATVEELVKGVASQELAEEKEPVVGPGLAELLEVVRGGLAGGVDVGVRLAVVVGVGGLLGSVMVVAWSFMWRVKSLLCVGWAVGFLLQGLGIRLGWSWLIGH